MGSRQRYFAPTALLAALVFVLALAFAPGGSAATGLRCAQTGLESVTTDQPGYIPGSVVHMAGAGFAPGCDVVVKVTRPDGLVVTGDGSNTPGSDTVTTDLFGGFSYDYQLQSIPAISGTYVVDALGDADTVLAHTTFEDAPKIDADIAPAYDSGSQPTTFSTLVRNTSGTAADVMRNVKITLPSGYTNISVASTAFSNGTWNAQVIAGGSIVIHEA